MAGYDKSLFVNPKFAAAFICISCQLICTDIRELTCNRGHLCCQRCWDNMINKHCPLCNNSIKKVVDVKRSRFVEGQQLKLQMKKCPNNSDANANANVDSDKCTWNGSFNILISHLNNKCIRRKEICKHCSKLFRIREFSIHRETCGYLPVSCPYKCDVHKKWLRMKISSHLKQECPNYVIKCSYVRDGCRIKLSRTKMIKHLEFECKYRIVQCPFTQYGCNKTDDMRYWELTNHLNEYQIKHLSLKLCSISTEFKNMKINLNNKLNEQSKQIEFLQRKLQFQNTSYGNNNKSILNLSNDLNGLLVFCGSKNGLNSDQNSVEIINIKNKSKHILFNNDDINQINRVYNHQYLHLSRQSVTMDINDINSINNNNNTDDIKKDDNTLNKDNNIWDIVGNGICCGYNISFSSIQSYLLNSSFGNNTSGISSIFNFNNQSFWNNERVSMIFRCGGYILSSGSATTKLSRVDGCVLETNDWFQLPYMKKIVYWPSCIYSSIHGLIVVGGRDDNDLEVSTVQILKPVGDTCNDNDVLKWDLLPNMFSSRYSSSICLWEDMKSINYNEKELLIVSGGYNCKNGNLRSCMIYDFNQSKWNEIADMNIGRTSSTLIHWKYINKCINVGGTGINSSKSVEQYDLIKDQWYKLPNLNKSHSHKPSVWIDNSLLYNSYHGILCVAGNINNNTNDLGTIEILDVRDNKNKWQIIGNLSSFFQSDNYKDKIFRQIVCC